MKRLRICALCALVLCLFLLCGCDGEKANPTGTLSETKMNLTSTTAKAGDTVNLTLSVDSSSELWGFSWEVKFDDTVLSVEKVEASVAYQENFLMDLNTESNPLIVQGSGRELQNYAVTGEAATLTFRVAENAAAGDYVVNVGCREGNNINVDAQDVPFVPVTATVTVVE